MMNVNWLAILICGVVFMAIGALWYSPVLFSKQWMKLVGKSNGMTNKNMMAQIMITTFIASLVMAYVLSVIIHSINPATVWDGAVGGFWTWLGFVATSGLINSMYQGKPLKLFSIDTGYFLVSLVIMGAILT